MSLLKGERDPERIKKATQDLLAGKAAPGLGGQVEISQDWVTITRSRVMNGLAGARRIPMADIGSVRVKEPGLQSGSISFSILGEPGPPAGALGAARDENSVIFSRNHLAEFVAIQEYVEACIARRTQQSAVVTSPSIDGVDTEPAFVSPTPHQENEQKQNEPWWNGIKPQRLFVCHYAGAKNPRASGFLKTTNIGFEYKVWLRTDVTVPWSEIATITIGETSVHHGRPRSAFGIGPLGLVVVGATMMHNRRARRGAVIHLVTITDRQGNSFSFVLHSPSPRRLDAIEAISRRLQDV